jgi:uncharacterized protein (DUF58 family)
MHSVPLLQDAPSRSTELDRNGWRTFFIAMGALALAMLLALYSRVAAENAQVWLAGLTALAALGIAGWVAVKLVPALARRSPLGWLAVKMDYRVTREGLLFIGGILVLAMAALNTGNNLLFLILATFLAGILISGLVSHLVLSEIELRLDLPEHIFAGQSVRALAELANHKRRLPSFSLRLCPAPAESRRVRAVLAARTEKGKAPAASEILAQPVYFPFVPAGQACRQTVELQFARRGVYRQEALGLRTRFPFGFVEKTRRVNSSLEAVVYPAIETTDEVYQTLALVSGELESYMRGRGHDLYAIRAYQNSDSVRHVDWKASAKRNALQVREFAREDERRVMLVLDPFGPAAPATPASEQAFEKGVSLCAALAWHFYEMDSVLGFRTANYETDMAPAGEVIYDILKQLALAAPLSAPPDRPSFLTDLADSDSTQLFKVILTRQPRGSIPNSLWGSAYIFFIES